MAITKETKETRVAQYKEMLGSSQAVVITQYHGLTMGQLNDLRARLRTTGARFQITKNTLFRLALADQKMPALDDLLVGPTAVAYLSGDIAAGAKALIAFAEETKAIEVKGGLFGDRVLSAEDVITLSKLPSREELLAQVVSRLQAPLYGLVNVLSGPMRGLVYALKARQEQLANPAA
ncbi:MAG: 50S ribosomal protein L10 [Chloroflexi bacterium]|nr:50S ribosomal protein L10 [Chloroflexota bacterium]